MSTRKIVILPESFSGPWSMGFGCPASIYNASGERLLGVIVTDPNITIPAEGLVLVLGPLDTLNGSLARGGFTRTKPVLPPPVVVPPPEVIPEPPIVVAFAEPEPVVSVPVVTESKPAPVSRAPRPKPTAFSRFKSLFRK